jgi:hypothetical protein
MPASELRLPDVYSHSAVKAFGKALRIALWLDQDYASLIELENAEDTSSFSEAIRKFLRRYKRGAKPKEAELESLMGLITTPENIRIVRSALVSYGLVQWDRKEAAQAAEEGR